MKWTLAFLLLGGIARADVVRVEVANRAAKQHSEFSLVVTPDGPAGSIHEFPGANSVKVRLVKPSVVEYELVDVESDKTGFEAHGSVAVVPGKKVLATRVTRPQGETEVWITVAEK